MLGICSSLLRSVWTFYLTSMQSRFELSRSHSLSQLGTERQCCPEFYSYNLTSNVRALHTERQLNPCLPKRIINYSGKKNTHTHTLFWWRATTGHFVYKKAIVDSVYQSQSDESKKMVFVKICILLLLCSLAGVCSFIRPDGKLAAAER